MASIRNTVVLAIMQVGVIVAGVLAAGLCHKILTFNNLPVPSLVTMLCSYGVAGFFIPLAWSLGAIMLQLRADVSEDVKTLIFWMGIFVLIALVAFVLYADVPPLFRVMRGMGSGGVDDEG